MVWIEGSKNPKSLRRFSYFSSRDSLAWFVNSNFQRVIPLYSQPSPCSVSQGDSRPQPLVSAPLFSSSGSRGPTPAHRCAPGEGRSSRPRRRGRSTRSRSGGWSTAKCTRLEITCPRERGSWFPEITSQTSAGNSSESSSCAGLASF